MNKTKGIYFNSKKDVTAHFLITLKEGKYKGNGLIEVYKMDIPQKTISNGDKMEMSECDIEFCFSIDLFLKYYFPRFKDPLQVYYIDPNKDFFAALAECINYSIDYGLKENHIIPL
ncbi:hypothetical protein ACJRPK_13885 [Aquimarina sp. 2-A2]|uniref:hypothetical protein n=1 Tax=Aquimarina sp. 2-A2 TaxID=3382644 RepID=UPI00387F1362